MRASTSPDPKSGHIFASCFILLVFCVAIANVSPAQTLTTLVNFDGGNGKTPVASLVQGRDGNFYGTTEFGGSNNHGTVFKVTSSGTLTVLYNFAGSSDGQSPTGGLVQASDGNFYGTTSIGGNGPGGTVFKITPNGTLTTLVTFNGEGGPEFPSAGLIQASDGNLYGTTPQGGTNFGNGTVFKITTSGTVTTLFSFACSGDSGCRPAAGLVQGSDGNFYGTTSQGGPGGNNAGAVFKITPSGTLTTLYNFCSQNNCSDGDNSNGALIQGTDGNFYGTTKAGGAHGAGTVFKITSGGTLTTLYSFCAGGYPCADGESPYAGLVQAGGDFYGTTYLGGADNVGTVFRVTPSGTLTTLHSFNGGDGAAPYDGLVLARDGNFYGTTSTGGGAGDGTVFQLTPGPSPTTTVLTSTPNPSHEGEVVTMTATVTAQNGQVPTGTVEFTSNGDSIGSAMLNGSGVAVLQYSQLPLGTDSLVATYQGSSNFAPSTSNPVQQVVELPASTTTVTSAPNPSTFGQQVVITATVGPPGPPTPTGTVGFTSNGTAISGCAAVPLGSSLTAVCTTSTLALGTDAIVATYSGDSNYSGSSGTLSQIVNPVPSPVQFAALTPCRVVDTRNPNGPFGGPPIGGHSFRSFPLAQSGNPCGIPSSAVAYSLNVTVVPGPSLGFLTIWPAGEGQPVVSTMNSLDGRVKANAAIIPAGTPTGSVSVYVTDTANVVLDIDGYFTPTTGSTLEFYPLTPCRVVDTRHANGDLGGPYLTHGQPRNFPVLESTCGIPNTAKAYSFNFTAIPRTRTLGYLSVWPEGQPQPLVSTLNDTTGTIVANAAIVPGGTSGGITVYPTDDTDLAIDVNGYFAPAGTGGLSLYVLTPCRVLDTRHAGGAFGGMLVIDVLNSMCAPPSSAKAYVFNATVVPQGPLGYLALWPDGQPQPIVSTLNAVDGAITSNMAIVPAGTQGKIDADAANGITQLLMDISSYFAP